VKHFSIILICLVAIASQAVAQVQYDISGTAPAEVRYVLLSDIASQQVLDTCIVKKGAFHFNGVLAENTFITLTDDQKGYDVSLIIDATPTMVSLADNQVSGSELNVKFNDYYKQLMRLQTDVIGDYNQLQQIENDSTQIEEQKRLKRIISLKLENITAVEKGIVDANMGNVISAFFLRDLSQDLSYNELLGYLNEHYTFRHNPILAPAFSRLNHLEKESKATATP